MRSPDPRKGSSRRWQRLWPLAVLFVVLSAFWLTRPNPQPLLAGAEKAAKPRPTTSYQNRARWPSTAPSSQDRKDTLPAITGTIYGPDGTPLVGASVVATTFQVAGNVPTSAGEVESDAHGRFELRLPNGAYSLRGAKEGYGPSFLTAYSRDDVGIVLTKSGIVLGHVYDEKKQPVTRFSIDVLPIANDSSAAPAPLWSKRFEDPEGAFRVDQLPDWPVIVRATAEGYAPTFSSVVVGVSGKPRELDLTLAAGCTVSGTVVDGQDKPLPYVFVDAESRRAAGSMGTASVDGASQAESDPEGRFRLEHVASGQVVVRGYDGSHAVTTVLLDVKECEKVAPIKLVMSSGGAVAGVVRRSDGTPVAGARLTASQRSIGYVNTLSDAEGRYRFEQLPATVVRIDVQDSGQHTVHYQTVKDGEAIERNIVLFGGGSGEIRGRITAAGKPLRGAQVLLASNHGPEDGMDMRSPTTDEDGAYRLTGLPDGAYMVMVASTPRASGAFIRSGSAETVDLDVAVKRAPPPSPAAAPPPSKEAEPAAGQDEAPENNTN